MKPEGLLLALLTPASLVAQGVVVGTVRDDSTGSPLAGVEIIVEGRSSVTTDGTGRYVISGIAAGNQSVLVRMVGYRPARLLVRVTPGDTTWANVRLVASAQQLEPLEVRTRPEPPRGAGLREEFEERRRMGFGKFIDSTMLRANEHRRIPDLLRSIPGLVLLSEPAWDCMQLRDRGRRRPGGTDCPRELYARGTTKGCYMTIMVDGRYFYRSGVGPPPDWNREFYVSEFEAIEVYRRSAELPVEFGGTSSDCGVIVLWTRRGLH